MLNLKFVARQCQIKLRIAQQPLTCSGDSGVSASLRLQLQADGSESASSSYECGARSKGKGRSTLASLRSLPSPYGLETASLVAFGKAVTSHRRSKALSASKKNLKVRDLNRF